MPYEVFDYYELPDGNVLEKRYYHKTNYTEYITDNGRIVDHWQAELLIELVQGDNQ